MCDNERFRDKISPQCKNSMCIFLQQSGAIRKPLIPTKFEKFLEYFCISMKKQVESCKKIYIWHYKLFVFSLITYFCNLYLIQILSFYEYRSTLKVS